MSNGDLLNFEATLTGKSVLVTGHSGFTGGWLCLWLERIGAKVTGLSLLPISEPNLFHSAEIENSVISFIGDIGDFGLVESIFEKVRPKIVFHLAAQPLVSKAYDDPIETFRSNIMGTANILEAARNCSETKAVVCVTTDKVYFDQDWAWGYRETDRLGGKDPYSASKAAAELIALAYQSTLAKRGNSVRIATARGGNILGGGDWSENRIVPDFVRAKLNGTPLTLRHPESVRPWQHVMALVHGYLTLASHLLGNTMHFDAWNFGPQFNEAKTVAELVEGLAKNWSSTDLDYEKGKFPEARFLHVDSTLARNNLDWKPPIVFEDTVRLTAEWYSRFQQGTSARLLCEEQIAGYRSLLKS